MDYVITQNFITKNRSYLPLNACGMVVHETATPNATDENERGYFNNNNLKASAHAFVDYNSITQTVPWNEIAWGAGPTANKMFIQIELCHFDGALFREVWNRGVWVFAWVFANILKIPTVTPGNLRSHKEVSEAWGETDHTDPYGFFLDNGKTIDDFRAAVQAEINNQLKGVSDMPEGATACTIEVGGKIYPGYILGGHTYFGQGVPVAEFVGAISRTPEWHSETMTLIIK